MDNGTDNRGRRWTFYSSLMVAIRYCTKVDHGYPSLRYFSFRRLGDCAYGFGFLNE